MTGSLTKWSPSDERTLKKMKKAGASLDSIAATLNRTVSAVKNKIHILGDSMTVLNKKWTPEEDRKLKELIDRGSTGQEISMTLGRPMPAITSRKHTLNIKGRIKRSTKASVQQSRYISQPTVKSTPVEKTVSVTPKAHTLGEAIDKVMAEARRNGVNMSFTVTME